jgi:hypothetical protein
MEGKKYPDPVKQNRRENTSVRNFKITFLVLSIISVLFLTSSAFAADWSLISRVTGTPGQAGDYFGKAVAVSGDTMVVGASRTGSQKGAAYVFVRSGSGWALAATLTASDGAAGDYFGDAVAISGGVLVIGAPHINSLQGAAYVFVNSGSGWSQAAKLTPSDGAANDYFGQAISISGDSVLIGAPYADINAETGQGAAYFFVMPEGGWTSMTETAKLTASDGHTTMYFGSSVAINGDTAAVGSPALCQGEYCSESSAYVFVKPASGWTAMTETAKLRSSIAKYGYYFGSSIAVSGDTVVVGAPMVTVSNYYQGAAYVYVKPASGWSAMTETAQLTASDGAYNDELGYSVAIDGDTVVAGSIFADGTATDQGAAYVFAKPAGGWVSATESERLTASSGANLEYFGGSVAISGDTMAIGAPYLYIPNTAPGAAYVFARTSTPPPATITQALTPPAVTTVFQGGIIGPAVETVTNNSNSSVQFSAQRYLIKPDGTYVWSTQIAKSLSAGETSSNQIGFQVPTSSGLGTFTFGIALTDASGNRIADDSFTFTVVAR